MCESLPNVRERETDDALCQARGRGFERKDGACQRCVLACVRVCVDQQERCVNFFLVRRQPCHDVEAENVVGQERESMRVKGRERERERERFRESVR